MAKRLIYQSHGTDDMRIVCATIEEAVMWYGESWMGKAKVNVTIALLKSTESALAKSKVSQ